MFDSLSVATPTLETIDDQRLHRANVQLDILRLDKIHPLVHGNKWFKLKLNLAQARQEGHGTLLSFGGAYSNHIYALAAATSLCGMRSIGLIRGELTEPLNPVLSFAKAQGMELVALTRSDYRNRHKPQFIRSLARRFGDFYHIPEGGSNELGVRGCEEIIDSLLPFIEPKKAGQTVVAMACGTGATLAGMIRGATDRCLPVKFMGIAVLKGADFLKNDVADWLEPEHGSVDWQIVQDYHCGGYAKSHAQLEDFMKHFLENFAIALEPVYTGKLLYGLYHLIEKGVIAAESRVICLHTGGLN